MYAARSHPKKGKHMHGATLKIFDADHISVEGWEDGAPAKEMCAGMKLLRGLVA